jgi:hypothetical protein
MPVRIGTASLPESRSSGGVEGSGIMERASLRAVIVLGLLVTFVGGTGIFAVFSDRATTGTSDVTSGELAKAADLKIAAAQPPDPMTGGPFICDSFTDDLATPLFSFTASTSGTGDERDLCVRNDGSSAVNLSLTAIDIVDSDIACTGDEAAFGDTTCGLDQTTMQPQAGELSPNLTIETNLYDCGMGIELLPIVPNFSSSLADLGATPTGLWSLAPGGSVCVQLRVFWRATGDAAQVSQSDEATWRFAFDGAVPSN